MGVLTYRDCGFDSERRFGCVPLVSDYCSHVEVSTKGRSLVQRSPTDCVCLCVCVCVCVSGYEGMKDVQWYIKVYNDFH